MRSRKSLIKMSIITQEKRREYNKRYYEKHRNDIRERQNKHYQDNREEMLIKQKVRSKKYYDKNRNLILERTRLKVVNNINGIRDRKLNQARERWKRDRAKMFEALGGALCRCGFSDTRALEIDHISGGGKDHRKNLSNSAYRDYVISNTNDFQVLCSNCHSIKTYEEFEYGKNKTKSDTNRR